MSDDLPENFPYWDFYYIKIIPGEKNPLESWGGYGIDPAEAVDSDDPDINIYTHDDVLASDHEHWDIVGIKGAGRSLLIYDLDIYKAPDFDPDEIYVDGSESVPVVGSPGGGKHTYTDRCSKSLIVHINSSGDSTSGYLAVLYALVIHS